MAKFKGTNGDDTLNGGAGDDKLVGKGGNDYLFGYEGDDFFKGGTGNDYISGGSGDDRIMGGTGDDRMDGGEGADHFKGGDGIDTADYSTATSAVTVYYHSATATGAATGDTFEQMENLVGSAYNDFLQAADGGMSFGGLGNDSLYGADYSSTGSAGTLRGDLGNDSLYMGFGNTRAWVQLGQGSDTIYTFDEGTDMLFIDLSEFGLGTSFDSNEIWNSNTVTATGSNAQFIYEDDASRLWFDSNGNGAGGLTLIAQFSGATIDNHNLGTDDFEFQL
jgi:Ca2+-binding RTX toxin-like protein